GMQFTFPGIPVIWAGDEFGLDGWNGENSRTPLPWNNEREHDTSMIEEYAALAALRKANPALVDGSMRFLYSSAEALVFIRENKNQSILVSVTRGEDPKISFPIDAVASIEQAKIIHGHGKIKLSKKKITLSGQKMSFNVWRLPATD
ncbi:MAG: hypothetical protein RLZZ90_469, partial [Actinomycetota bacterium]